MGSLAVSRKMRRVNNLQGREISEEGETSLKCRGWQLLELIKCYGRLSLLQCTSAQFEPGDEMLVLAMEGALSNLAEERSESSWKRVLVRSSHS